MRRFANVVVCTLALVFCLAALPVASMAQATGGSSIHGLVKTTPRAAVTPSPNAVQPATALAEGSTVIYSNLGTGDTYSCCEGWIAAGPDQDVLEPYIVAMSFTPTKASYVLTQLDLALSYYGAGPNALTVELCGDADGVPGKVIDSWFLTGLPTFSLATSIVQTIQVKKTIVLVKGFQYWLVPIPYSDEAAVWNSNATDTIGLLAYSYDGGPWGLESYVNGAFDVLGTVLPQSSGQ